MRTRSQPKWISHVRRRHTRGRCIICRYMRRILQNAPGAWPCRDPPVHFRGRRRCCRPPARRDGAQGNRGGSAQPTRLRRLCDASAEHAPAAAQRASPGRRAAGPHDHPPIVCDGCTQDVAAACRAPLDAHADACARAPAANWGIYGQCHFWCIRVRVSTRRPTDVFWNGQPMKRSMFALRTSSKVAICLFSSVSPATSPTHAIENSNSEAESGPQRGRQPWPGWIGRT